MNPTYIDGNFGQKNTGNDAELLIASWAARRYYGAQHLMVNTPRGVWSLGEARLKALVEINAPQHDNYRAGKMLEKPEVSQVIFAGGKLFEQGINGQKKIEMLKLAKAERRFAFGVGLGPFDSTQAENLCAEFLQKCQFVGVRDEESLERAKAIAPDARVALTFDLTPALLELPRPIDQSEQRKGIALSLCALERINGDAKAERFRLVAIAKSLDLLHYFTGEVIHFVDFDGGREWGDAQVHREVASYMDAQTPVCFHAYSPYPCEVLNTMASFRVALCMRRHAAMFAHAASTPIIALNGESEMRQWCVQIGVPYVYQIDANNIGTSTLTNILCAGLFEGFASSRMSAEEARDRAMSNFHNRYFSVEAAGHQSHDRGSVTALKAAIVGEQNSELKIKGRAHY